MKIALVGDTHADERHRFDEHNRIMEWIGCDAAARGCSLFLHSGDVWERKSTGLERLAVADWARQWTQTAPLVVVAGNHCDPLDIEWLGRLRTRQPVFAMTHPAVVHVAGCAIACLPWPRKAHLLAQLPDVSRAEGDRAAVDALTNILRGFGVQLDDHRGPRLFLGHVQTRGCRVSLSQPPLMGCDYELGLEDLSLVRAQFYALGHIHLGAGNEWTIEGAPAAYPGSPRRCNFGETEPKGYIIVEFDGSRFVGWERVETPATPMIQLTGAWRPDHGLELSGMESAATLVGAELRLRYAVASEHREAARADAEQQRERLLAAGAVHVQLEPEIVVETRARMPAVVSARRPSEKLEAYWTAKGFDPGERRQPLLDKFAELETSATDAA